MLAELPAQHAHALSMQKAGDMSGYQATRSVMGDMVRSLERDP